MNNWIPTYLCHIACFILNPYLLSSVQEGILRLHPDLAGKIAQSGQLTQESSKEQSAADLNQLTLKEKSALAFLNSEYKKKFGFPFVICARLNKKEAILKGLETRCQNSTEMELHTGIKEVLKICELRVRDIVKPTNVVASL